MKRTKKKTSGLTGNFERFATIVRYQGAISQFYLAPSAPNYRRENAVRVQDDVDVFSINEGFGRRTKNASERQRERRRRCGRKCTGWNGTPVKSKTNRVAFYDRKDGEARGEKEKDTYEERDHR